MHRTKAAAAVLLMAAVIGLSFIMPAVVSTLTDQQLEAAPEYVRVEEIQFRYGSDMTSFQQLRLLQNAEVVPVSRGNVYDNDTAFQKAVAELAGLTEELGIEFDYNSCWADRAEFNVCYDFDNTETFLIVWSFAIRDSSGQYELAGVLEEESGRLLNLECRVLSGTAALDKAVSFEILLPLYSDYLDVTVADIDIREKTEADGGMLLYGELILTENGEELRIPAALTPNSFSI